MLLRINKLKLLLLQTSIQVHVVITTIAINFIHILVLLLLLLLKLLLLQVLKLLKVLLLLLFMTIQIISLTNTSKINFIFYTLLNNLVNIFSKQHNLVNKLIGFYNINTLFIFIIIFLKLLLQIFLIIFNDLPTLFSHKFQYLIFKYFEPFFTLYKQNVHPPNAVYILLLQNLIKLPLFFQNLFPYLTYIIFEKYLKHLRITIGIQKTLQ